MSHKSTPTVEFLFEQHKNPLMGLYKSNANVIIVYLKDIRTPQEIFDTLEHEALHAGMDSEDFVEDEEHLMIDRVIWERLLEDLGHESR